MLKNGLGTMELDLEISLFFLLNKLKTKTGYKKFPSQALMFKNITSHFAMLEKETIFISSDKKLSRIMTI